MLKMNTIKKGAFKRPFIFYISVSCFGDVLLSFSKHSSSSSSVRSVLSSLSNSSQKSLNPIVIPKHQLKSSIITKIASVPAAIPRFPAIFSEIQGKQKNIRTQVIVKSIAYKNHFKIIFVSFSILISPFKIMQPWNKIFTICFLFISCHFLKFIYGLNISN